MVPSIDAVDPADDSAPREWFAVEVAAHAVDRPSHPAPSWTWHRALLTAPWPGEEIRAWIARVDGRPVGAAFLALPGEDNTDTASTELTVHPDHRRTGIGTRLLAAVTDAARAAGRTRMALEACAPLTGPSAGTAFAAAAGAREALVNVRRRLVLDNAPVAVASPGYDLVQWHGDTPDEWCADIGELIARVSTDAPSADPQHEAEVHDAERVRRRDALCRARGIDLMVTAARSPDGRLAAFTEITTAAEQDHESATWFTAVLPEHRGQGLGLQVKLANLGFARTLHPAIRHTDTYNAVANVHMIAINEAMGFRPLDRLVEYQLEL